MVLIVMAVTMLTMERCRSKWLMVISWLEELNLEDNSCLHNDIRMVVRLVRMVRITSSD